MTAQKGKIDRALDDKGSDTWQMDNQQDKYQRRLTTIQRTPFERQPS